MELPRRSTSESSSGHKCEHISHTPLIYLGLSERLTPCAMALRLTSCSSRRTALLLRRRRETDPANLTPAPRRPNRTTSPYAQATHVSCGSRVHRISPHVRDDGQRPSSAVRRAELCDWFGPRVKRNIFDSWTWHNFGKSEVICPSCWFAAAMHRDCACTAKQISSRSAGWARRKHAGYQDARSMTDGGHGARAPLPTSRRCSTHRVSSVAGFDADFDCWALAPISWQGSCVQEPSAACW